MGEWRDWMLAAGLAARTIDARLEVLYLFFRRTGINPLLGDWRACSHLLAAISHPSTKHNYYMRLNAWYRWLVITERRLDHPLTKLQRPKVPRAAPRPVTTIQLETLLASGIYRRTRAMVLLASYQGLRVSEIARMRGELIEGDRMRVIGKGGVEAVLPLHPRVAELVPDFPTLGWWFPSPRDRTQQITSGNVTNVIGKAMRRAGFPCSAHQLRHWFGTEVLRASGGNLRTTQELMRHASPASTAIYTLVDSEQRRRAIDALPWLPYVS